MNISTISLSLCFLSLVKNFPTISADVSVSPNILNEATHDSDEALFTIVEAPCPLSSNPTCMHGEAHLSSYFVDDLKRKIGVEYCQSKDNKNGLTVPVSILSKSSIKHVDYHAPKEGSDGVREPVNDDNRVAFVLLNSNPDAYFQHGETIVPISEGNLVHFEGGTPHNTVVNSGVVHMLGSFDSAHFKGVSNPGYPISFPDALFECENIQAHTATDQLVCFNAGCALCKKSSGKKSAGKKDRYVCQTFSVATFDPDNCYHSY